MSASSVTLLKSKPPRLVLLTAINPWPRVFDNSSSLSGCSCAEAACMAKPVPSSTVARHRRLIQPEGVSVRVFIASLSQGKRYGGLGAALDERKPAPRTAPASCNAAAAGAAAVLAGSGD